MLLVIDIGNTNIVIGIYNKNKLIYTWRLETVQDKSVNKYKVILESLLKKNKISGNNIKGIIVSSVVPALTITFDKIFKKYFHLTPLIVSADIKTGIIIKYHNPKEVGADRIVNAVAVYEKYSTPAIVIDFGTATTFDYITEKGEYLGGAIIPGIGISAQSLHEHTAKLPRVNILKPPCVVGKNTVHNIQSGIFYGTCGQIKEIISKMIKEISPRKTVTVIATGGYLEIIKNEKEIPIDYFDPYLTLTGLKMIYKKNFT